MAQFSEVLAKKTLDAIKGTASGLVEGAKGALVSQVPAFALSAAKFFNDVKKEVEESNKKEEEEQKKQTEEQKKQTEEQKDQTKEEKKQSQYLGDSNKWLDQLAKDTRIMRDKLARDDKFAEEVNNEKKLLDEKMLSTLEDIRDSLTSQGAAGEKSKKASEEEGSGILGGLAGTAATSILGGAAGGAGAAAAGGVMARYILPAMRAIIPRILPLLLTAIRFAGPVGFVAGTGLALANIFTDKEGRPNVKKGAEGAGGVAQKSPIKTQGEFLEKTKKYFGGSEEVVTKLTPERVQKYITDVSKKETKTNDPDNEINPTSYAMGKIQLMPFVVKELSSKVPGLDKSFATLPIESEKDKKEFVEKWKKLSPEEKQKFYTAYVKQNYESLTGAIVRAPTESEFYAAQFGVTNVANAIKNQSASLTPAQNAAAVANASALGVKPASPAGAQQDANRQGVATAQQNKDAAQEEANKRLREIGEADDRLTETKDRLKAVDTAYQVQKETYDSLSKKAKLTPEEQAKRDAASKRMQDLNFESESLKALRATQEDELENAQKVSGAAATEAGQASSVLRNQRQITSEQNAVLEAEKQKQEKEEKKSKARERLERTKAVYAAAMGMPLPEAAPPVLVGVGREKKADEAYRDFQEERRKATGRDATSTKVAAPVAPVVVSLSIDTQASAFDIATGGQGGVTPTNVFTQPGAPSAPTARSIVVVPPVALANTSQTQTAFQTTPMMPPWASPLAPGLLPLSGSLDFGQTQLYTPAPEGSGTNTQKFEAKTPELILDSLKKIEQNTSKTAQGQAEANKRAEKDRRGAPTGRGRGATTVPFKPTLSGKGPAQDAARDKFYTDRFSRIIQSTGTITKNLINSELNKLFFPKGQPTGVSRTQGDQLGFLVSTAGRELKLGQKSTKFLSKIFGDKVGRAYGGAAGEALGLGIEQFAGAAGRGLGFGEGEKIFNMGQILGNFSGNKQQRKLGREQLIYNLTGIPTGATTIFREVDKFFPGLGLKPDPNTGKVSFDTIAKAGGNFVSEGLSSLFGIPLKNTSLAQTRPGAPDQSLAETLRLSRGAPSSSSGGAVVPSVTDGARTEPSPITPREQSAFIEANIDSYDELQKSTNLLDQQSTRKDDQSFFGGMANSISDLGSSIMRIFTGAGGGTGGGMGGGGRFGGGGGGFFDNLMNMGGNLLTSYLTYKIAGGLTKNIKDPKKKMIADLVIGEGIKYGLKTYVMPYVASGASTAVTNVLGPGAGGAVYKMLGGTGAPPGAGSLTQGVNPATADIAGALGGGAVAGAPALAAAPLSTALAAPAAELGVITGLSETAIGANLAAGAGAAGGGVAAAGAGSLTAGIDVAAVTAFEAALPGAAAGGGTAAGASTMLAEMGAFLANPVTIAVLFVLAGVAMMSKGGTPHYSGFSKTKGSGFDRSWHADDKHISAEYTRVTDPLAMSAKSILDKHAANVGSTDKFEVAIAIGSDNEDPSYSIYQIYKNGTVIYDSGQEWGLPISFPDAVKTFVDKRLNGPLVEAMRSVSMTDAQKTTLGNVSEYTTAGQISDFVQKGSTDASLLTPTYAGVTAENAGFEDITFGGGGESGNDTTTVTPMVYSLKDKTFVPIKETVSATGTSTDDVGREQQYTYQTADKTVLGYDENGNPIRAADLNRKVGTASSRTGGTATVTASTTTPVTDYYNQTQQSFNATLDNADTASGGGNNTAVIAPTNVVDNSVRTNTTIVNTDTRNSDPVLFKSSRRVAFVD